jgi:hypothetical protein
MTNGMTLPVVSPRRSRVAVARVRSVSSSRAANATLRANTRDRDSGRTDARGRERSAPSGSLGIETGGTGAGRARSGCKDAPWGCALCGARNRVGRRRCDLCHAAREVSQPTPPPTGQCPKCRVIGSRGPGGVCMSCGLPFAGHRDASRTACTPSAYRVLPEGPFLPPFLVIFLSHFPPFGIGSSWATWVALFFFCCFGLELVYDFFL